MPPGAGTAPERPSGRRRYSLCPKAAALAAAIDFAVISSVKKFRDEYLHHVTNKSCLPETTRYRRLDMPVAAH